MEPSLHWLTDPTVFRVNRLDAHSDHVCYASPQELAAGETSLRQSLDGVWDFAWSRNPGQRPERFWQEDFDDAAFGTIRVPGHMELQGHGEIQYINTLYPWDGRKELRPPEIDWENTHVGSYVRRFDLEPGLLGKRVCISFQGVEQAFYVWLNGSFVGYAEDSFTPSDFDLTPYIRETGNRLCVEVYQHSSAAWLEDQDFFRFSGIFRSVYLYAKPAVHVDDLWLQTGLLEDNTTGTLQIRLILSGAEGKRFAFAPVVPIRKNAAPPLAGGPCLSLWERWPSAARTERVNVDGFNGRYHSKETPQGPLSLGCAEPALPEGEPSACGLRYRVMPFTGTGYIRHVAGDWLNRRFSWAAF